MPIPIIGKCFATLFVASFLTGCYEPASTYDPKSGHFRSTQEMKKEQEDRLREIERQLDSLDPNRTRR